MARTGVVLLKMGSLNQHCPHHQELGGEVKTQAHLGLAESGTPGIEGEIAHVHGLYGYTDKLSVLPALLCGLNTIPLKIPQSWFVIVKKRKYRKQSSYQVWWCTSVITAIYNPRRIVKSRPAWAKGSETLSQRPAKRHGRNRRVTALHVCEALGSISSTAKTKTLEYPTNCRTKECWVWA
jgi:hypothetical protein